MRFSDWLLVSVVVASAVSAGAGHADEDWRPITPKDVTREQWDMAQKQAAAFMGHIGPSKSAGKTVEYSLTPAPRELATPALTALVTRLQRSFYVGRLLGAALVLEGDVYFVPGIERATLDVTWKRVLDGKGKNVLEAVVADGGPALGLRADGFSYAQALTITAGAVAARAEGTAKLTLPVSWSRIDLPCKAGADGHVKALGAIVVACSGDFVQVEVSTPKRPIIVAMDAQGRAIEAEFRETSPVFTGGRAFEQLKYEDLPVSPIAARISYRTKGLVASVSLYFPDRTESRTFPVTAVAAGATGTTRTQHEAKACTGLERTTVDAVRAATKIEPVRSYAMVGYNTPGVRVTLPRLDNSYYARVDVGDATVIDGKGQPVPHKAEAGALSWPEASDDLRLVGIGDGAKKPLVFAHAKGTMRVRYPTAMHVVTLTKSKPSAEGISLELHGNKVRLRGEPDGHPESALSAPGCFDPMRAYDARGERIVQLPAELGHEDGRDVSFWGTPVELRFVVVDRWDDLALDYDVAPAPMLPEGHEGETPE